MTRAFSIALVLGFGGIALADDAASKKLLKDLEGNYTAASIKRAGEDAPADFLKGIALAIKGDTFTIKFKEGEKTEEKNATIVIDTAQKPTAIDLTPKDGPEAGKPMLGIIKVEKDTVTYCWSDRGDKAERPKEFSSTKENKQFLIVMKKAK